jgi:hypothetical protein
MPPFYDFSTFTAPKTITTMKNRERERNTYKL